MTNEDLARCQAAAHAALHTLPSLVRTDAGEMGYIDQDGTLKFDTDALFDAQARAREALIIANELIQAEQPRTRGKSDD